MKIPGYTPKGSGLTHKNKTEKEIKEEEKSLAVEEMIKQDQIKESEEKAKKVFTSMLEKYLTLHLDINSGGFEGDHYLRIKIKFDDIEICCESVYLPIPENNS